MLKLERAKVFRDPIYGYITIEYELFLKLIDTYEFQRLRRIRQLSGVSMVFQTAEHSRFTHSLGAYELARQCLIQVEGLAEALTEYEQLIFLASAMLHDIGHGPYSHAFEHVMKVSHEQMSINLILGDTEINKRLKDIPGMAEDIANVIGHKGKYPLIESLVSSQLDVDRMDYLSRDAYFTGAAYGNIDYRRILRSMKVIDNKIVCRASGVNSLESYIMARYHMYWQVYYHKKAHAYDLLLQSIYHRIYDLAENDIKVDASCEELVSVMKDTNDLSSYVLLDDSYVNGLIKQLTKSSDLILRDLALSFEKRSLFTPLEIDSEKASFVARTIYDKMNPKYRPYYYFSTSVRQTAYLHSDQSLNYDINDIKILDENNQIQSLEDYSPIIKGLILSGQKEIKRIFYKEPLCMVK